MSNLFFFSDPHFFDEKILTLKDAFGERVRPFGTVEEMNEHIIERYNSVVRDGDKVYWLGDITFDYGSRFDLLMSRLRGRPRLVFGNHDKVKNSGLLFHFKKAELWATFGEYGFVCTHKPLHPVCLREGDCNVHGDLHEEVIPDRRYISVCPEVNNYTPVPLEEIQKKVAAYREHQLCTTSLGYDASTLNEQKMAA